VARNRIYIDRTPEEVFDFLEQIEGYPSWVPGAKRVPEVEESWPKIGAEYRHVVGWGPFEATDTGTIVRFERPHRISLDVNVPYVGVAQVDIDVESSGEGSLVTLEERMDSTHASTRSLFEPGLHLRNADALRRLKSLVEAEGRGPLSTARALVPPPHWLQDPDAALVLRGADTCYLAVETASGPHVTPVAFASVGGRLWTVVPRDALKTRMVRKRPPVSACLRSGDSALMIQGEGEVLDLKRAWELPGSLGETLISGLALGSYALRNAARVGGYLLSSASAARELMPLDRVLLAVRPAATATTHAGVVTREHGHWPKVSLRLKTLDGKKRGRATKTGDLPAAMDDMLEGDVTPGVLAWTTETGPLTFPGTWNPVEQVVRVPRELFALGGRGRTSRAALCLDTRASKSLADQQGLMLRGDAEVLGREGDDVLIRMDPERTTYWQGADTETVPAS
jgi:uncharacterized protein YndB with AHSA1/START domain